MTDQPSVEEERRSYDRRVGLPDSRPADQRLERRAAQRRSFLDRRAATTMGNGDREDYRRTVLYLAASPPRLEWLRRFLCRHLEATATRLDFEHEPAAAGIVRGIASRVRAGDVPLW